MKKFTFKCHKIVGGIGKGEALVAKEPLTFTTGLDSTTGKITLPNSALFGKSIKDKVIVFTGDKGTTFGPFVLYSTCKRGNAPAAIISLTVGPVTASGVIMCNIPTVDKPERDPFKLIRNGDYVIVDGDKGLVQVQK